MPRTEYAEVGVQRPNRSYRRINHASNDARQSSLHASCHNYLPPHCMVKLADGVS